MNDPSMFFDADEILTGANILDEVYEDLRSMSKAGISAFMGTLLDQWLADNEKGAATGVEMLKALEKLLPEMEKELGPMPKSEGYSHDTD